MTNSQLRPEILLAVILAPFMGSDTLTPAVPSEDGPTGFLLLV